MLHSSAGKKLANALIKMVYWIGLNFQVLEVSSAFFHTLQLNF